MRVALALVLFVFATVARAGGTAFDCRYIKLSIEGRDQYELTLEPLSEPDTPLSRTAARQLVLHIRWTSRSPLPSGHEAVSHDEFVAAMSRIRKDLDGGLITRFGILGNSLFPLHDSPGHYIVYAVRIEDEGPTNAGPSRFVVYAQ